MLARQAHHGEQADRQFDKRPKFKCSACASCFFGVALAPAPIVFSAAPVVAPEAFVPASRVGFFTAGPDRPPGDELRVELPLFGWGDARVAKAVAVYMQAVNQAAETAIDARSEVRLADGNYLSNDDIARDCRDEVVPLKRRISEENQLRYNGMLIGDDQPPDSLARLGVHADRHRRRRGAEDRALARGNDRRRRRADAVGRVRCRRGGRLGIDCHKSHHTMNAMGHDEPTMIGKDYRGVAERITKLIPDYTGLSQRGMDMAAMQMPLPENTAPMMCGEGPMGLVEMGGMFSAPKVR